MSGWPAVVIQSVQPVRRRRAGGGKSTTALGAALRVRFQQIQKSELAKTSAPVVALPLPAERLGLRPDYFFEDFAWPQ
jgi:hypothetical protein